MRKPVFLFISSALLATLSPYTYAIDANSEIDVKSLFGNSGSGDAGGQIVLSSSSSSAAEFVDPIAKAKKSCESREGSYRMASCSSSGSSTSYYWDSSSNSCKTQTRTIPKRNCK
jgi:hypothetical protein